MLREQIEEQWTVIFPQLILSGTQIIRVSENY